MIAEELEYVSSSFLTKFQYLDKELFVDSSNAEGDEFPVLLMDWVDGVNLDRYIRDHIGDRYQLHLLAYQFSRLALWLMPQPFAHGDLKPDNIMVREDGTLVLIDYDGMFVPAMRGQTAREMGSPDFRLLSLERPSEPEIVITSEVEVAIAPEPEVAIIKTEVTEEDEKDAWEDEFGVQYSEDGKKLLACFILTQRRELYHTQLCH